MSRSNRGASMVQAALRNQRVQQRGKEKDDRGKKERDSKGGPRKDVEKKGGPRIIMVSTESQTDPKRTLTQIARDNIIFSEKSKTNVNFSPDYNPFYGMNRARLVKKINEKLTTEDLPIKALKTLYQSCDLYNSVSQHSLSRRFKKSNGCIKDAMEALDTPIGNVILQALVTDKKKINLAPNPAAIKEAKILYLEQLKGVIRGELEEEKRKKDAEKKEKIREKLEKKQEKLEAKAEKKRQADEKKESNLKRRQERVDEQKGKREAKEDKKRSKRAEDKKGLYDSEDDDMGDEDLGNQSGSGLLGFLPKWTQKPGWGQKLGQKIIQNTKQNPGWGLKLGQKLIQNTKKNPGWALKLMQKKRGQKGLGHSKSRFKLAGTKKQMHNLQSRWKKKRN